MFKSINRISNRISRLNRLNRLNRISKINRLNRIRNYHQNVLDHYENPRNVGSLDKSKKSVGTGLVGAPACGDVMRLQIEVEDGKIIDAKFKTFGCGSAIAASSVATEWIKGQEINEVLIIKNTDMTRLKFW